MMEKNIKLQDINIDNVTQRTVSIIGGKGSGKTTFIKMLLDHESPCVAFDPLNVIDGDLNGSRIGISKTDDEEKIGQIAKIINHMIGKGHNLVIYFDELLQEEIKQKVDWLFPKLIFRDTLVIFDEIHEFVPRFNYSKEVNRYIRHCRNKNNGIVMSTQRPAMVETSVIALTDYLILFRLTWKNDLEATKEILQYRIHDKKKLNAILSEVQKNDFMTGYAVDFTH